MIEKITNQPLFESGAQLNQINSGHALPDNNMDVSVQVNHADLMKMAMQAPQSDPQLLERARQALLSGELESQENILEAAEYILKYGI